MADGVVLDSSAALAVLLGEAEAPPVRAALAQAVGQPVLVLDLFWLEVGNVLVRRHGWDVDAVIAAVRELDELGIETVALDRPLVLAALDLATRHGISIYDAAHLAVADAAGCRLLTLDERLARAAGARSAIDPGPAARETRIAYRSEESPPDWARHGRYLAELRRATMDAPPSELG
jgi:predicted nucleic acid-binding protein